MEFEECVDILASVCGPEDELIDIETSDEKFENLSVIRANADGLSDETFNLIGPSGVQYEVNVRFSVTGSVKSVVLVRDNTTVGVVQEINS